MRISTEQFFETSLRNIQRGTSELGDTQKQISTGVRIMTPSDDPVASAKVVQLQERISLTDQYQSNIKVATSMVELSESVLGDVTSRMQRVRDLTLQSNNSSLSDDNRRIIANEMRVILDGLQDLMNSSNGLGGFLYSGFQTLERPFIERNGGGYDYQGDEGINFIQISTSAQVQISDSGKDLFIDIPTTNPTIAARASPKNSTSPGSSISVGAIVNPTAFGRVYPEDYIIEFNDPELNQNRRTFTITRASDGKPVMGTEPPGYMVNVPYEAGARIEFEGVEVSIVGQPEVGDRFLVESTSTASILNMVHRFATVLETLSVDNVTLPEATQLIGRATPGNSNINTAGNYVASQEITVIGPENQIQKLNIAANTPTSDVAAALNTLDGVAASVDSTQATLDFRYTEWAENEVVSFVLNGQMVTATVGATQAATLANIDGAIAAVLPALPTLSSTNNGNGTFSFSDGMGNNISIEDFQVTDFPEASIDLLGGVNAGDNLSFDLVGSAGEMVNVNYTVATGTIDEFYAELQNAITGAGAGASFNLSQPSGPGSPISLQYVGDTDGDATVQILNFSDGVSENAQLTITSSGGTQTINQSDGAGVSVLSSGANYTLAAREGRSTVQFSGSVGDPVTLLDGQGDSSVVAAEITVITDSGYSIESTAEPGRGGVLDGPPDFQEAVRNRFQEAVNFFLEDFDRALEGVTQARAEMGARLNTISSIKDSNEGALLELKSFLSDVRDLDYAEAVTRLNIQTFIVEAAQQSFVRITQLSLFRLL
jgi:flagellar hook-associated protein 3 FlgL